MEVLSVLLLIAAAYLYGSVNLGLILVRGLRGIDLRSVGSGRAGTANVSRTLGKGWAFVVFLFDLSKSVVPMVIAGTYLLPDDGAARTAALVAIAAAAIAGHCRPVFFGFDGGGGVVTALGAYLYFVPVEIVASALIAFLGVQLVLRGAEYSIAQWTPIVFLALAPLITLAGSPLSGFAIAPGLVLGGHPPHVGVGVLAISVLILLLNPRIAKSRTDQLKAGRGGG